MFKPKNTHATNVFGESFSFEKKSIFLNNAPSVTAYYEQEKENIDKKAEVNTSFIEFNLNADENIRQLAAAAFKNPDEATRYEGTIRASLKKYLRPDLTIDIFWGELRKLGCSDIQIQKGIMKYFRTELEGSERKKVEIQIHQFLKPLEIPATSREDKALDTSMVRARNEVMANTGRELQNLLQQIGRKVPNLPPPPSSIS